MKTYRFTNEGWGDTDTPSILKSNALYHGTHVTTDNGEFLEISDIETGEFYGNYYCARFEEVIPEMNKIVIVMDGGVIQNVLSAEPVEVIVVDYDTSGLDDEQLTQIGRHHVYMSKTEPEINPAEIDELSRLMRP